MPLCLACHCSTPLRRWGDHIVITVSQPERPGKDPHSMATLVPTVAVVPWDGYTIFVWTVAHISFFKISITSVFCHSCIFTCNPTVMSI